MTRAAKFAISGFAAAAVALIAVLGFSSVESRYQCTHNVSVERPQTIFLKLTEYRWWVGLWSNSTGSLWLEIPNSNVAYFGHLTRAGDLIQIFDKEGAGPSGNFSTLSNAVELRIAPQQVFEGRCARLPG